MTSSLAAAPLLPPPRTPPSPGPATRSPGGPLRARSAAPPEQPGVHSPQSRFAASTTGKNPYVRPRAPCTSAPPHADGEEWGGLDRDVFSRAAAARCLGSSEGCPARPVVSLTVDGRPIPMALRHRHVLERLWSERGGRRPPWDLLRLPARGASARREPRRPTPGRAPRRPAAACRWSHGEAGRVAQRGRAVLPGGCARGSPSGRGFRRAGWPGPPRGCAGGAPPALPGGTRGGAAVRGHFYFSKRPRRAPPRGFSASVSYSLERPWSF